MKLTTRSHFVLLALALTLGLPLAGHTQEADKLKQFVYVLRVAPTMHDEKSWSDADNRAVGAHFARLQKAAKSGQVIMAGRTTEPLDKTFGLVIFKAESTQAAEKFMNEDPAVVAKLMTATLHPYAIALQAPAPTPATTTSSATKLDDSDHGDTRERHSSGQRATAFFRSRCFANAE
jgi:uncharacterized protein YciI